MMNFSFNVNFSFNEIIVITTEKKHLLQIKCKLNIYEKN